MMAGVTERVWSLDEVIALLDKGYRKIEFALSQLAVLSSPSQ